MVTLEHEALVDLFRRDPALLPRLLAAVFATPLPAYDRAVVIEASLGQLVPTELRADLVIELRDENGRALVSIVPEAQRDTSHDKRVVWPLYVAAAGAKSQCAACLVVVTPDAGVARWAARPIDVGLGRMTLVPIVFGPNEVPRLDEETARGNLELAVLSVIVHGDEAGVLPTAKGAIAALADLTTGQSEYVCVIMKALQPALRASLRKWIMGKDETKEQYLARFRPLLGEIADVLEAEGKAEGEARALLRVLAARGLTVTEAQRERVLACRDLDTLDRWLERAVTAMSADDALT